MDRVIVHVTDRQTFRRCRREYYYNVIDNLEPIKRSDPLVFGTVMHRALASYYRDGLYLPQAFLDKAYEEFLSTELTELGEHMCRAYCLEYPNDNWEVLGTELPIKADVPGTMVTLTGTLDLLIRDKDTGRVWAVDHKTYKTFPTQDQLSFDDQMTAYLYILSQEPYLSQFGRVRGALYNMLRKKIPDTPKVLARGGISKDRSIDTTPQIYKEAVVAAGCNMDEYMAVYESLFLNPFFKREKVIRSTFALKSFGEEVVQELRDIAKLHTSDDCKAFALAYPNKGWECSRCSFFTMCGVQTERGDVQSIADQLFTERRGRG